MSLPEGAQGLIGTHYRSPDYFDVGREKVREFAQAVKDDHPSHYSEESAAEAGYDSTVASLTFWQSLDGVFNWTSSPSSTSRSTSRQCCTGTRNSSTTGRSWPVTGCISTAIWTT